MDIKEDLAHLVHPDKKEEHKLVIVASILTIILFVLYLKNQAAAAQAAAAGTNSAGAASGGTGAAGSSSVPTSSDTSGYVSSAQESSDVSGLQGDITSLSTQFQTALNGLAATITSGASTEPSFSISVNDTGTNNRDAGYATGDLSGATQGTSVSGGAGGLAGLLGGGLGSIFGLFGTSKSGSNQSSTEDTQAAETALNQTVTISGSGYDSSTLAGVVAAVVGLANNAVTAIAAPTAMPGNANSQTPFWVAAPGETYHQDANNIFTTTTAPGGTNDSGGIKGSTGASSPSTAAAANLFSRGKA